MKEMEFNFEEKDAQKFEDFFKALHKHYTDSKKSMKYTISLKNC